MLSPPSKNTAKIIGYGHLLSFIGFGGGCENEAFTLNEFVPGANSKGALRINRSGPMHKRERKRLQERERLQEKERLLERDKLHEREML